MRDLRRGVGRRREVRVAQWAGMSTETPWHVTFWRGKERLDDPWSAPPTLRVGDGLIMGTPAYRHAPRWRVVDIWHSYDKHGHFDLGTHVFLELVSDTDDDVPLQLAPRYFGPAE